MIKLNLEIGTTEFQVELPSNWDELTRDQFIYFVNHQGESSNYVSVDVAKYLIGELPREIAFWMLPSDYFVVQNSLKWMLDLQSINRCFIDTLEINGTTYYGCDFNFDNVSYEEFMYADSFAEQKQWDIVAGVLFRPERENWNHECDRRIPFTSYGTEFRFPEFGNLEPELIKAIEIQYIVQRKHMTDNYPRIFFDVDPKNNNTKGAPVNWVSVMTNLMGDKFYEREKFYSQCINLVLARFDNIVKEQAELKFNKNAKH